MPRRWPRYWQDYRRRPWPRARNINLMPEIASKTPEEKEADAAREKAYRESLRKIPDAKGSADPWGNVRAAEPPKPAPAKAKTKTGSTAN